MMKLCIFGGSMVFSYAGWYVGTLFGFEMFGCFLVSGVFSIAGVWAGWKLARSLE
ncbi:MAG: hypothetical protein RL091_2229 [Verrucomicrobiota bacterium]|jgi:hypothetical protein